MLLFAKKFHYKCKLAEKRLLFHVFLKLATTFKDREYLSKINMEHTQFLIKCTVIWSWFRMMAEYCYFVLHNCIVVLHSVT